jgi:hypothetical protein
MIRAIAELARVPLRFLRVWLMLQGARAGPAGR